MPSISVPDLFAVISAATANTVTVTNADGANVYPGTFGWVAKDDASASTRIKVLNVVTGTSTTVVTCRIMPNNADEYGMGYPNFAYDSAKQPGGNDLSSYGSGSHLCINRQSAPIDPAFSKRDLITA